MEENKRNLLDEFVMENTITGWGFLTWEQYKKEHIKQDPNSKYWLYKLEQLAEMAVQQ